MAVQEYSHPKPVEGITSAVVGVPNLAGTSNSKLLSNASSLLDWQLLHIRNHGNPDSRIRRNIATIMRSGYSEHESCLDLTTITVPVDYGRLKRTPYRCGTCRDARPRLTILNSPSPRMSPLARIMMGVSDCLRQLRQYQLINPPIVRAMVKDGVLYMPK